MVKNLLANTGDMCSIPGSGKSPGEGNGNPLQYSSLGNPIRERSLMGYHPWDHKKVRHDSATKQQHNNGVCIHTHTYIYMVKDLPVMLDPWVGKIPWRRKQQLLQYSCLENPMDRGAW